MTIAIGRVCTGGIIIAADTRISWEDGRTSDVKKIRSMKTGCGMYVMAHSSHDANTAESLMVRIEHDLNDNDPRFLMDVEGIIKNAMTTWYSDFGANNQPDLSLLVAAFVNPFTGWEGMSQPPPWGDRKFTQMIAPEMGLYLCQPPNTVVNKMSPDGYVAIGVGANISDPLFNTLFNYSSGPRVCLGQISYLMHRAKKDYGAYCGGQTDAVFLDPELVAPLEIKRTDMAVAESFGPSLDRALSSVASAIIPRDYAQDKEILEVASRMHGLSLGYLRLQFRSTTNIEIH
jgi:hypothetical protein